MINVVVGRARSSAQRLVEHPDVAKIGFTGSTEVGQRVMQGAAETIKRVTLELGGKSANVVFADADLEKAAAAAPYAVFDNAGQDCCARSRILVERSVVRPVRRAARRGDGEVKVGTPTDDATEMGPLISAAAPRTVASFVDGERAVPRRRARRAGLLVPVHARRGDERRPRRARRGLRPGRGAHPVRGRGRRGAHRQRHALRALRIDLDARRRARAARRARARHRRPLRSTRTRSVRVSTPFGGFKQSGFGRELGMQALAGYSEVKNVFYSTD